MHIAQLANFWTPTSGGLRVTLDNLAREYRRRGHRVTQVVPGVEDGLEHCSFGTRIVLRAPLVPGAGGYRAILPGRHLRTTIESLGVDALELSDRTTMVALARSMPSVRRTLIAHERIDGILGGRVPPGTPLATWARHWNRYTARHVDRVVAPSTYVADEWRAAGVDAAVVPWGVDLVRFEPDLTPRVRDHIDLVWVGRLSAEKRPALAIEAVRTLHEAGVAVRLLVVGDGPDRHALQARGQGLPVAFTGHATAAGVARALRRADLSLSTSGIEAFGLAVVESLASGTPVVAVRGGAAAWLAGPAGAVTDADAADLAAAILRIDRSVAARARARDRATRFGWAAAATRLLAIHQGIDDHERSAAA